MTSKQQKEHLFYTTFIDTVDKLVVYGNLERSKEEAMDIAKKYTTEVFNAMDDAYLDYLSEPK